MPRATRVVVVGGGIAGLSVLAGLARRGQPATLLEREAVIGAHASGRNAAIHRPLERDTTTAALVAASRRLMADEDSEGHLRASGLVLATAEVARAERWAGHAAGQGVAHRLLDAEALLRAAPHLAGGALRAGVWVDQGGVLDIHAMLLALAARARAVGSRIRTGVQVGELTQAGGRISGVRLTGGELLEAEHVVLAAGAWARGLGEACGCAMPLLPVRRHLVQLGAPSPHGADGERQAAAPPVAPDAPVVWRIDGAGDEVYLRPEGGGLLCSPCDEAAWPSSPPLADPPSDPAVLELLAAKLASTAPALAGAEVQHYWACLRTFAPDGELVAGADPRLAGLHWMSGLGGRGMSVGPALGQWVADRLLGRDSAELPPILAARLAAN